MARIGGVHAFGNNSAESEPISMKSGTFWVHCQELAFADFGHDLHSSDSWRAKQFFCQVSNTRFHWFPECQISRNLNTSIGVAMKTFRTQFWQFYHKGSFFHKLQKFLKNFQRFASSGIHNTALIIGQWKFTTKCSHCGTSRFHFYCWNQYKIIPLASTVRTWMYSQIFSTCLNDAGDAWHGAV